MDIYICGSTIQNIICRFFIEKNKKPAIIVTFNNKKYIKKFFIGSIYVKGIYCIKADKYKLSEIKKIISNILKAYKQIKKIKKIKYNNIYIPIIIGLRKGIVPLNLGIRLILFFINSKNTIIYDEGFAFLQIKEIIKKGILKKHKKINKIFSFFLGKKQDLFIFNKNIKINYLFYSDKIKETREASNFKDLKNIFIEDKNILNKVLTLISKNFLNGFDNNNKIDIVFLSQPLTEDNILSKEGEETEILLNFIKQNNYKNCKIGIKLHPRENKNKYDKILKKYKNISYIEIDKKVPWEVMYEKIKPKYIVGFFSTALFSIYYPYTDKIYLLLNNKDLEGFKTNIKDLLKDQYVVF